jgi:hypothetical protein
MTSETIPQPFNKGRSGQGTYFFVTFRCPGNAGVS